MQENRHRNDAGLTLLELLVWLGVVALIGVIAIWLIRGGGSPPVPGADDFTTAIDGANSTIASVGAGNPTPVQCQAIRDNYDKAQKALQEMQQSGKLPSTAVAPANDKLNKIQNYIAVHCS
jgi:hypothetical protein